MNASVGQIVQQLHTVITAADQAAVQAARAGTDALIAHTAYTKVGQGSNHPKLHQAVADARTAADKLGKVARLLADAADAFTDYVNAIAPGTAIARKALPTSTVSGEQLLDDTERRASRAAAAWRRQITKADDGQDSISSTEDAARNILRGYKKMPDAPGSGTSNTQLPVWKPADRPHVDNPITAVAMATAAMAVAVRGLWNTMKKRRERKDKDGD
jgi:hypothetical protein